MDNSEGHAIRDWAREHLTTAGYLDEVTVLRAQLSGTSGDARQACRPVRVPEEVRQLPQLLRLRDAEQSAASVAHSVAHSRFPQPGRF
ncbi:hypothetical protein OG741_13905 [Streptomyces sp. NBC_01410]|uniref:hypothetical protein n=1 Tax=Streptomyces sp. NBC_01410 TaxID=2903856 RepID=UPI0032553DBD